MKKIFLAFVCLSLLLGSIFVSYPVLAANDALCSFMRNGVEEIGTTGGTSTCTNQDTGDTATSFQTPPAGITNGQTCTFTYKMFLTGKVVNDPGCIGGGTPDTGLECVTSTYLNCASSGFEITNPSPVTQANNSGCFWVQGSSETDFGYTVNGSCVDSDSGHQTKNFQATISSWLGLPCHINTSGVFNHTGTITDQGFGNGIYACNTGFAVQAQSTGFENLASTTPLPTSYPSSIAQVTSIAKNIKSAGDVFFLIRNFLFTAVGLTVLGVICYAGFVHLTAKDDPEKTKLAWSIIVYVGIGVGVIAFSVIIVRVLAAVFGLQIGSLF